MYPQDAAIRIFQRALRMNPQTVSFYSRVAPGATGNWSAGSPFTLYRATFPLEGRDTLDPVLKVGTKEWTLCSLDLANANAPNPKIDDRIVDSGGAGWTIKAIQTVAMNAAFICKCVKELPVNAPIN